MVVLFLNVFGTTEFRVCRHSLANHNGMCSSVACVGLSTARQILARLWRAAFNSTELVRHPNDEKDRQHDEMAPMHMLVLSLLSSESPSMCALIGVVTCGGSLNTSALS